MKLNFWKESPEFILEYKSEIPPSLPSQVVLIDTLTHWSESSIKHMVAKTCSVKNYL